MLISLPVNGASITRDFCAPTRVRVEGESVGGDVNIESFSLNIIWPLIIIL